MSVDLSVIGVSYTRRELQQLSATPVLPVGSAQKPQLFLHFLTA